MASSVIGALRVNLGLDSAQFTSGMRNAQKGLGRFGVQLTLGVETIARELGRVIGALPQAIKSAVDRADDLGKMAQSVGVSVEALSRLEYAAKLSDVSIDGLGTGLRKLAQNMVAVTTSAAGPAATAFAALGINVKNADGSLRGSTVVLGEVADKFARMEDGAMKTALAVAIFGKSGADLIPLLNEGSAGIGRMADESDRLGLTISTSTAKSAERFNDTLTAIGGVFQGIIAQLAEALLPALEYLSQAFLDVALDSDTMKGFLEVVVVTFKSIVTAGIVVIETLKAIGAAFNALQMAASLARIGQFEMAGNILSKGFGDIGTAAEEAIGMIDALWSKAADTPKEFSGPLTGGAGPGDPFAPTMPDLGGGAAALKKLASEGAAVFDATRTAAEKYSIEVERLNGLLANGAINQDTYNRAIVQAQDAFEATDEKAKKLADSMKSVGQSIGQGLKGLIDGTKEWKDVLVDVLGNLAKIALQNMKFGKGPGGNLLQGVLGGLFGFAQGGSFRVGGSGGIDSQLVAFKASPDEQVSIHRPGDDMGGGRSVIIQQSFPLNGVITQRDVVAMVQQGAAAAVNEVKGSLPGWQVEQQRTGGVG